MKNVLKVAGILALVAGTASADVLARHEVSADLANGIVTPFAGADEIRANSRAITTGDTYQALLLGQSTAGAAFVTATAGRNTTFVYDGVDQLHGTLTGSAATVNCFEDQVVMAPNVLRVVSGMYTANSSGLWINGLTIGGQPMTQGRHDVGGPVTGFTNGLLWDNLPGPVVSVSIFSALLADGTVVATSSALTNVRTLPEMGSAVVWNGVVGTTIDEVWMVFDITYLPAPSATALLGLGGLIATRRRR